jgi:hypothetical protein
LHFLQVPAPQLSSTPKWLLSTQQLLPPPAHLQQLVISKADELDQLETAKTIKSQKNSNVLKHQNTQPYDNLRGLSVS